MLSVAVPEAMVCPLLETADGEIDPSAAGTVLDLADDCAAVLLGPGLMDPDNAEALLAGVVPKLTCTVAVDAVGMAYLTAHPEGLGHLEGRAVLTPNQTELAITLGMDEDEVDADPVAAIVRLATTAGATVVSGSATTWVASPEGEVWVADFLLFSSVIRKSRPRNNRPR